MNNKPVALVSVRYSNEPYTFSQLETLPNGTHELYTHPIEWQYLTDAEILEIVGSYGNEGVIGGYTRELFDKIEAKIKEKNERIF